jgi:hypothetical protein
VVAVAALRSAVRAEAGAAVGRLLTPLPGAAVSAWAEDTLAQDGNNFGRAVAMEAGGMGGAISTAARSSPTALALTTVLTTTTTTTTPTTKALIAGSTAACAVAIAVCGSAISVKAARPPFVVVASFRCPAAEDRSIVAMGTSPVGRCC